VLGIAEPIARGTPGIRPTIADGAGRRRSTR